MGPRRPDERLPVTAGSHPHRRVVPGIVAEVEVDPGIRRDEDELAARGPVPDGHRRDRDGGPKEQPGGPPAGRDRQDREQHQSRRVHDRRQSAQEPRGEPPAPAALRRRPLRAVEGRHLEADRQRRRQQLAIVVDEQAVQGHDQAGAESHGPAEDAGPEGAGQRRSQGAQECLDEAGREESRPREPEDQGEDVRIAGRLPVHRLRPSLPRRQCTRCPVVGLGVQDWAREIRTVPQREDVSHPEGESDEEDDDGRRPGPILSRRVHPSPETAVTSARPGPSSRRARSWREPRSGVRPSPAASCRGPAGGRGSP